jgi:hypothetical protein
MPTLAKGHGVYRRKRRRKKHTVKSNFMTPFERRQVEHTISRKHVEP